MEQENRSQCCNHEARLKESICISHPRALSCPLHLMGPLHELPLFRHKDSETHTKHSVASRPSFPLPRGDGVGWDPLTVLRMRP